MGLEERPEELQAEGTAEASVEAGEEVMLTPEEQARIKELEEQAGRLESAHLDLIEDIQKLDKKINLSDSTKTKLAMAISAVVGLAAGIGTGALFGPAVGAVVGSAGYTGSLLFLGSMNVPGNQLEKRTEKLNEAKKILDEMEQSYSEARAITREALEEGGAGMEKGDVLDAEGNPTGEQREYFAVTEAQREEARSEMNEALSGGETSPDMAGLLAQFEELKRATPLLKLVKDNLSNALKESEAYYFKGGKRDDPVIGRMMGKMVLEDAQKAMADLREMGVEPDQKDVESLENLEAFQALVDQDEAHKEKIKREVQKIYDKLENTA